MVAVHVVRFLRLGVGASYRAMFGPGVVSVGTEERGGMGVSVFAFADPPLALTANLTDFVRTTVGAGYRFALGMDDAAVPGLENWDAAGFVALARREMGKL